LRWHHECRRCYSADQEIVPFVEAYPAGTVYEFVLAQTVAVSVLPCVAVGAGAIVRVNVVEADAQVALLTVIVSVTVAPEVMSAALNV
jgi:hypothetical protein